MSRNIFVRQDPSLAILVNYKCGFATINNALVKTKEQTGFALSEDPGADVRAAKRSVLFVREPAARFRSFFRNWIVYKRHDTADKQLGYTFSKRWMTPGDFNRLISATPEEKNTPDFLEFFLRAIGPAILTEQHTAPQWRLLQINGLGPDDIDQVLNYQENLRFLKEECGQDVAVRNVTLGDREDPLDCPALNRYCEVMYARDYEMFGDHF